jgi:hypothetical protein
MNNEHAERRIPMESSTGKKSGRVAFCDDGRSVWEWQTSTGIFSQHITEEQMRRLEAADLQVIDPTPPAKDAWEETWGHLAGLRARPQQKMARRTVKDGVLRLLAKWL